MQKMLIICQIDWREVGVAFELQCLRSCTLSSFYLLLFYFLACVILTGNFPLELTYELHHLLYLFTVHVLIYLFILL